LNLVRILALGGVYWEYPLIETGLEGGMHGKPYRR
jgi:hypothetical protein